MKKCMSRSAGRWIIKHEKEHILCSEKIYSLGFMLFILVYAPMHS